ncbi:unnamed protein product [Mytilus edulis]|uniref:Uncharacterized protein n=1 Tax=Mytilus edulis TaxID=6550 RepID=A0A8S3QLJ3_MYTED|nr:unnamed protein product [Mytilus edulis]
MDLLKIIKRYRSDIDPKLQQFDGKCLSTFSREDLLQVATKIKIQLNDILVLLDVDDTRENLCKVVSFALEQEYALKEDKVEEPPKKKNKTTENKSSGAERKNNSKVVLIRDKLYVNDELVTVSNDEAPREEPHQTPIRPKKRSRVSSTPDRDGHKSKTDDLDEIDIPNFEIKMKNRFTLRRVKSGGIVLCFRTHLADKINMVDTDSKYIMWFTVDKEIFRLNQNVLFGIVYIPPENSSYCIGDPYNEMENEF